MLVAAVVLLGFAITFVVLEAKPALGAWVFIGFCVVMGVACLHSAFWHAFGSCELAFSSTHLTLYHRCGPFTRTRRMQNVDVRKVERVEQINSRNGNPYWTRLYVYGPGRPWMFGQTLSRPAVDHLWAELSRRWKSSIRIEKVDPYAD